MKKIALLVALLAVALLAVGCMTPRQTEAAGVLQEMLADGRITREQFNILLAALSPSTWVSDVITIGGSVLAGGGAYVATNLRRNSLRRARGEPVTVPTKVEVSVPADA